MKDMGMAIRTVGFLMWRWILAAVLFSAFTTLLGGLILSVWYQATGGPSMWTWLRQEFGEYYFKTLIAWLVVSLVYPKLQRGSLMLFRKLIDLALMGDATGRKDTPASVNYL
jgi:hypothetical protein